MRSPNQTSARSQTSEKRVQNASFSPEPTLEELLAEPIIRLVMAKDGIEPEAIRLDLHRLGVALPLARELA